MHRWAIQHRVDAHVNADCVSGTCRVAGVVHLTACTVSSHRSYTQWLKSLPGQQVTPGSSNSQVGFPLNSLLLVGRHKWLCALAKGEFDVAQADVTA